MPFGDDPTLGKELAARRLRHRLTRLELALRELRRQAQAHRANDAEIPVGLVRAMREFEGELAAARSAAAARASTDAEFAQDTTR